MPVAPNMTLSDKEKKRLEKLARSNTASVRLAHRARMLLLSAGLDNKTIAAQLKAGRVQAGRWRQRYAKGALAAIEQDLPRGGRKPAVDHQHIIELTTQTSPEHALVLCCDEKSQVQAVDRSQPGLLLKKGRAATMAHAYQRHGTTTLFTALNSLDGAVISRCESRHRHTPGLKFLKQANRETPQEKTLHLICDNYATHKHAKVKG